MDLRSKHCVPCHRGTPALEADQIGLLLPEIPGWQLRDGKLQRSFTLKDFVAAMGFLNRVAEVAEQEGHHPDFCVHYRKVDVTLWTHAIDGLSENDFILAAKITPLAGDA